MSQQPPPGGYDPITGDDKVIEACDKALELIMERMSREGISDEHLDRLLQRLSAVAQRSTQEKRCQLERAKNNATSGGSKDDDDPLKKIIKERNANNRQ